MSLNILVLAGASQHPQYARDGELIAAGLSETGFAVTQTADASALHSLGSGANQVVVLYTFGDYLDEAGITALEKFVRAGGGLVGVHTAIATNPSSDALGKLLGARIVKGYIGEHKILISDPNHPIAHRVQEFRMDDELYVTEQKSDYHAFLAAWFDGKQQPMGWSRREGKGHVVYLGNGHTPQGLTHPTFKQLLARSVRFAAGEDWSQRTVKCAAVGYGQEFKMAKLHLQSAVRSRMQAVAVADIDPAVLPIAEADFPAGIETYNNVDDLLAMSGAELLMLVTPHNIHAPMALQAIKAGRHVVTEKPFTINIDEATAVIHAARAAKKMATVFHNRRWDGDFVAVRDVVRSGAIGDVYHVECGFGGFGEPRPAWWRSYKDISGGAFFDWGAHYVDWALQLLPHRIESVSGEFKKLKWHHVSNEDYSSAYVRFEGGRTASFETGHVNAIPKAKWRVLGTAGGIEMLHGEDHKNHLRVVTIQNGVRTESKVPVGKSDWDGFYRNVADHLLLAEPLAVTPESARKVIAVLNLADLSSQQGGRPLDLPFEQ
jgi:predicted dehydrogenase/type 1 glutamine amidotransferase